MDTFPLFVYQALAELPPKQAQLLRALAEEDRTLFYETMRKESLYQGSNPVIYIPRKEKKPNKPFEPKKDNIPMQISLGETVESAGGAV